VTLTFGGDVHFQARVARLLDSPGTVFGPAAARLSDGDLSFVNLETPITSRGTAEPKTYLFRAGPQAARALTAAGVDAVTLANNHSMDYGRVGLADTFAAANAAHLGYFGAGRDVQQAYAPWRATVRGVRIAVFGFSQVDDLAESWAAGPKRSGVAMAFDTRRAAAAVEAARPDSDLIVVMPHWGEEGNRCPTQRQQDFAELMAHAGADVIVGAHAHVLQGGGYLGGTYVAYGLGNLLWYSGGLFPPYSSQSGILTLTLRGRKVVGTRFTPTVVSGTGRPRVLSGRDADIARLDYLRLRVCAGLSSTGS
jgi:poly-gamma-glutamate synthesis protein (capsule biosynthesis protein)